MQICCQLIEPSDGDDNDDARSFKVRWRSDYDILKRTSITRAHKTKPAELLCRFVVGGTEDRVDGEGRLGGYHTLR